AQTRRNGRTACQGRPAHHTTDTPPPGDRNPRATGGHPPRTDRPPDTSPQALYTPARPIQLQPPRGRTGGRPRAFFLTVTSSGGGPRCPRRQPLTSRSDL